MVHIRIKHAAIVAKGLVTTQKHNHQHAYEGDQKSNWNVINAQRANFMIKGVDA